MSSIRSFAVRFLREEEGASMVEYALLVAAIAVVVIAGTRTLGTNSNGKMSTAATAVGAP